MQDKLSEKAKAFWLGLFIILAIALLVWLVTFLKPGVGDGLVQLRVRFTNIDKISKGSRVTYAGKPVGEVVAITEVKDPRQAHADADGNLYVYELLLNVDSSIKIFSYDEINFATSGLLGEKTIAIVPKAPPRGAPASQNTTQDLLYARSSDRIDQTLNKLCCVADTLQETMQEATRFLKNNSSDFNVALTSFTRASCQLECFMEKACSSDVASKVAAASDHLTIAATRVQHLFETAETYNLVERLGTSCESLGHLSERLSSGEGSFAKLINSDCFYVQFTTVLCQLRAILDDINHYGVLYQFDRKWKRSHSKAPCVELQAPY